MEQHGTAEAAQDVQRWLGNLVSRDIAGKQAVKLDEAELRAFLDHVPVAILVSTDPKCRRIIGNAAACGLYGLPAGVNFSASAPPDELPPYRILANGQPVDPADLPMQRAARTGEPVPNSECEIRFADGRRIFIAGHTIPIRNESGQPCGSIGAFVDITAQKEESELARVVSQEMSHRLKNTIAIIQGISRRTIWPLIGDEAYRTYEERLVWLGRTQDLLSMDSFSGASLADIAQVTVASVAPAVAASADRVSIGGPPVTIPARQTLAISMVLHELATNACKYGALKEAPGRLSVTWEVSRTDSLEKVTLDWTETNGRPVVIPSSEGFGTSMMQKMAASMVGGSLTREFAADGLRARLSFALVDAQV